MKNSRDDIQISLAKKRHLHFGLSFGVYTVHLQSKAAQYSGRGSVYRAVAAARVCGLCLFLSCYSIKLRSVIENINDRPAL